MTSQSTLGAYRFIAELGRGGMADVYLAAAEGPAGSGFTKLAVVKKLRTHLAEDPSFVTMLMDEARVTARLAHPNVVQLFEVGCVEEQYFLAMEFLEGQPLHRVARRIERTNQAGGDIKRELLYAIVSDALAGLHHAHELADYDGTPLNVVHRDVTPHNVFVTYDGVVKVVDFGIAKAAGRQTETQHGVVKGKIRYMSPEQAACRPVDRRTDVFAAGVMLWNLSTGTKMWGDRTDAEVAQALFSGNYPMSPRELCPEVPGEIDAICRKALSVKREDRYATAADMRADIEAFLGRGAAEIRKTLTTTMREIFVSDRAKLRKVLESAALTSAPSVAGLAAARARKPRRQEHTELMAAAPARPRRKRTPRPPVAEEPSLAPMSVAPATGGAARARARASKRLGWGLGVAAALLLAVAGRQMLLGDSVSEGASAPRVTATVASELTRPSQDLRAKADQDEPEIPGAPHRTHASRTASATQSVSPSPAAFAPFPSPTPPEAPVESARRRAPKGGSLDNADPWSGVRP